MEVTPELGAIAYWTPVACRRDALSKAARNIGLPVAIPSGQGRKGSIKVTLDGIRLGDELVRELKDHTGYTVVRELKDTAETITGEKRSRNRYETRIIVRTPVGPDRPVPEGPDKDRWPVDEYHRQRGLVSPYKVARVLVGCAEALGGFTLRPSGGIHWLPPDALNKWTSIVVPEIEAATGRAAMVTTIRLVHDSGAASAILDTFDERMRETMATLKQQAADGLNVDKEAAQLSKRMDQLSKATGLVPAMKATLDGIRVSKAKRLLKSAANVKRMRR
jgi:hypothetical protein